MKIKALIVDDEKNAADALRLLLEKTCEDVTISGIAGSVVEAMKVLNREGMDLLFLDVEMPGGTGFDLLDLMKDKDYYIIFTTAHREYAIEAIKKGARDYLLKPIDPDELIASVHKAKDVMNKLRKRASFSTNVSTLSIHTSKGIIFLNKEDIVYIKASGRYSEIFCRNEQSYTICKNIGEYEQELAADRFFRVHKSFLINCRHVVKIQSSDGGFVEMINQKGIEISKRRKSEFIKFLS